MMDEQHCVAAHLHRSSLTPHPYSLGFALLDLKRELRVDVAAVVARAVRKLRAAALGTTDVMDRRPRVMRAALALSCFTDSLDGLHDDLRGPPVTVHARRARHTRDCASTGGGKSNRCDQSNKKCGGLTRRATGAGTL